MGSKKVDMLTYKTLRFLNESTLLHLMTKDFLSLGHIASKGLWNNSWLSRQVQDNSPEENLSTISELQLSAANEQNDASRKVPEITTEHGSSSEGDVDDVESSHCKLPDVGIKKIFATWLAWQVVCTIDCNPDWNTNTEKAVEPKIANRANASTHRKVVGQLTKQQQNRARQLVALVPKPGAKSDLDESKSSGDELQYNAGPANSDRIVYDFLIYGGDDTFRFHEFTDEENSMGLGSKVVLALTKSIHQPACKILCFDNFFTSIELLQYLREEYGKGRGSHAQVVCNKNKIVVIKWYDNKCVTAASTFVDAHPIQTVSRYNKDQGRNIPVTCPNTGNMVVDLADMLVALYRTPFRGHRWYLPIFSQMLDICVNNAWLLYRQSLRKFERTKTSDIGRLSSNSIATIQKPVAERPPDAVQYDQIGHYPKIIITRGRCMYCTKGQTKFFCQKCEIRLCLLPDRNCFLQYHTKNLRCTVRFPSPKKLGNKSGVLHLDQDISNSYRNNQKSELKKCCSIKIRASKRQIVLSTMKQACVPSSVAVRRGRRDTATDNCARPTFSLAYKFPCL
ncbi:hypothetical protein HW555_007884 [Spodoptera exigua]|uniref:PiggyBac transposable element-derived protein domain-containing protein n=1 Tax=Spodoptera exigua TaxID=7107 RepID=A0A835L8G1_SPOEX|nr:hypothetical protein HW555_007884 [Spodoptera exigua]